MDEDKKEQQPPVIDQLKDYVETRIKIAKLKAVDSSTSVIASIIADLAVVLALVLVFIFGTITLGFYLSELFDSFWQGFGCIALVYVIIAIILKVRKPNIQKTIANGLIQKILN
ncbi:MAG: hypothetical protein ABI367_05395 [Mucilaginibacter sp.]